MRTILWALLLLPFVFYGCATTGGYERVLQSWVGNNVNNLIQKWGPPTNEYKLPNGNVMYTWLFDGGVVAMPIGNMAYAVNRSCKTTFTANGQGIIET